MACSHCSNPKVFSRGLCSGCYSRLRRRGTLARKNVVNDGSCAEPGCDRGAFAKGFCSLHYHRARHPLVGPWTQLRSRDPQGFDPRWADFTVFLSDVGERPSPTHQLRRPDPTKPWGALNFVWREPAGDRKRIGASEYARRWDLRKKYGLTVEDFNVMMAAQNGCCAICSVSFASLDPATGKPLRICVDHDHVTGKARGLLCDPCNKGLGMFSDDQARIGAAIAYLESHAAR